MHPRVFDGGVVLARTDGVRVEEDATPLSLLETLGPLGAELLVRGIEEGVFVPPLRDVSVGLGAEGGESGIEKGELVHAPKISPKDREIVWSGWSSEEVLLRDRALGGRLWDGGLWARVGLDHGKWDEGTKGRKFLRATFEGPWRVVEGVEGNGEQQILEPGKPYLARDPVTGIEEVRFATVDGKAVVPAAITQESGRKGQGMGLLVEKLRGGS